MGSQSLRRRVDRKDETPARTATMSAVARVVQVRGAGRSMRATSRQGEVTTASIEARRRWARATWFAVATTSWSPFTLVNKLLPAGSSVRGLVLTLIPLAGVRGDKSPNEKPAATRRSTSRSSGTARNMAGHFRHGRCWHQLPTSFDPCSCVAGASDQCTVPRRGYVTLSDPVCHNGGLTGLMWTSGFWLDCTARPSCTLQFSATTSSSLGFSIQGNRLQGLSSSADVLGFLAPCSHTHRVRCRALQTLLGYSRSVW